MNKQEQNKKVLIGGGIATVAAIAIGLYIRGQKQKTPVITNPISTSPITTPTGVTITITPISRARRISAKAAIGYAPSSISATATVSGGVPPYTLNWDWGDSSSSSTGATVTHIYTAPGTYTIAVTATDSNGQTVSGTGSWQVVAPLGISIGVTPSRLDVRGTQGKRMVSVV